ncbi:MAG: nucleotidyl transferase AbiEii/AbiGii toxin family protein [Lacipirellulaceae bacterium]
MPTIEEVEESLLAIVALLDRERIRYAVMGGLAVRVYTIPRATQDVDITIEVEEDRLPNLRDALYDAGCSIPPVYDSGWLDRVAGMPLFKVARHVDSGVVDVDLFVVESAFQASMLRRTVRTELKGRTIWLVSPEDLVLLKLAADRPRDRIDVQDLLFALGDLDEAYLDQWAERLGVTTHLATAVEEFRRP